MKLRTLVVALTVGWALFASPVAHALDATPIVKGISQTWRSGNLDAAYAAYRDLFNHPEFSAMRVLDQRSCFKLMILARGRDATRPAAIEAHQAAIPKLTAIIASEPEPNDYLLLGISYEVVGDRTAAEASYREGFRRERDRNASSDLGLEFMKRLSSF
jgi:hypothetical protein